MFVIVWEVREVYVNLKGELLVMYREIMWYVICGVKEYWNLLKSNVLLVIRFVKSFYSFVFKLVWSFGVI